MFKIDPAFTKNSLTLVELPLCELRLMQDGELDWFLLIPRREKVVEWIDLSDEDQLQLAREIDLVSRALREHGRCDKINMGSLGNLTPQFHWHIIGRLKTDRAWPGSVWGSSSAVAWDAERFAYWKTIFEELRS